MSLKPIIGKLSMLAPPNSLSIIGLIVVLGLFLELSYAKAEEGKKLARIGVLGRGVPPARIKALQKSLGKFGYVEGRNIVFEYRYAKKKADQLPLLAAGLVRDKVDLIVAAGTPAARSAKKATAAIPIVMHSGNPVGTRLLESLANPAGNITGMTVLATGLYAKRLELLSEVVPSASHIAVLWNPRNDSHRVSLKELEDAASGLGLTLLPLEVKERQDIDGAFSKMKDEGAAAFLIFGDQVMNANRKRIVALAGEGRLPAIYTNRRWVNAGGLMSYGVNMVDLYGRMGTYVGKILRGTKPADLPIERPKSFELFVDLKIAEQLGITMPPAVLYRADKVIK